MKRSWLLILLALALPLIVYGAAVNESPTGQQNAEVFNGRDQNALATPKPNFTRFLPNNAASIAVPTPAAGQCIWGDVAATSATNTYTLTCPDGVTVNSNLSVNGNVNATTMTVPRPLGEWYDTTTQVSPVITPHPITFDSQAYSQLMTFPKPTPTGTPAAVDRSAIQIDYAGYYKLDISCMVTLTSNPASKRVRIWMRVNGVDQVWTGTAVEITTINTIQVITVPFIQQFNAGDYVQFVTASDTTSMQLIAVPAQTPTPGANAGHVGEPSCILTAHKVSF